MSDPKYHDHIIIENSPEVVNFTATRSFGAEFRTLPRNRETHGELLERQWRAIWAKCDSEIAATKDTVALPSKDGIYVQFSGAPGYNLKIESLEDKRQGIRLLNAIKTEENTPQGIQTTENAVVYIPNEKRGSFLNKIEQYLNATSPKGKPRNQNLIDSIEDIKIAFWNSMWTGKPEDRPEEVPLWCEVWLRNDKHNVIEQNAENVTEVFSLCQKLGIKFNNKVLFFPERNVCLVQANAEQLQKLIDHNDYIAELRRASETAEFFLQQPVTEQIDWIDELNSRLDLDFSNTTICVLDTGVTNGHPLLETIIPKENVQTLNEAWGLADHDGHGTEMCGIAAFYNLQACLEMDSVIHVGHMIESVKIISQNNSDEHDPDLYGDVTRQAIYMVEIEKPTANRVVCLAITSDKYNTDDGSPTSWSAEIDNIASGAHDEKQHLVLISGGNVYPCDVQKSGGYPNANYLQSIHSPGQAWNAITVGAFCGTDKVTVGSGYNPVAKEGSLSPYSSTSLTWDKKWPIKPELLCDGGNMVTDGHLLYESEDVSLLTTANNIQTRFFTTIWGTSSATAQAANIAARIYEKYPTLWPETVRALMIHSATWTPEMLRMCDASNKSKRRNLLRTCGYGIPSIEKALYTLDNSVDMLIQGTLSPYIKTESGTIGSNEMHIHDLPWPSEVLLTLDDTPVSVRITLSYFIEPGPGNIGWKDRYRYPSCLLRFDLNNMDENIDDFKKRINRASREDEKDNGDGTSGSDRWYLGKNNRNVGSIHSDVWNGTAAELCNCKYIGVYPAIGWWRERGYLERYNRQVRYALVVSLETPDISINLYTPIMLKIKPTIKIPVKKM